MTATRARTWIVTAALATGAAVGAAGVANAAGGSSGATGGSPPAFAGGSRPSPATMRHGPGETLLTGSAAFKARAAALRAVPGATVIRVETDSAGAAYEAHLTKADGSVITVKMNSSFAVTGVGQGFGGAPGAPAP